MIKNLINETFPDIIQRNLKKRKIAQKVYENFVLLHLKKYPKAQNQRDELKNILHINTAVGKGGAAKVAYKYLNKNLQLRRLSSKVLTATNYLGEVDDIIQITNSNKKLHKLLHRYSRQEGLLDFYNLESFNIPKLEDFNNADLIHLHNLHGAYFSPFVLPYLTSLKPTIWTFHDEQALTGHCAFTFDCEKFKTGCGNCPDLNFYPKIKKDTTDFLIQTKEKIYNFSDFTVVCPSNWMVNQVKQSILKNKDIRVIYNGVNIEVFNQTDKIQARKELDLPPDKKILMFTASGSIKNPQKGGKYIFEAYELLKNHPDIIFLNIGGGSSHKKANWIDIPYINDENKLALYYSASDLFIYPSQAESFGLVIAEAMSCQTPVVAFNNTAIPELVKHKETGYLAENRNTEDFVNGIKFYLENTELRENSGALGRELVLEKFTLERMLDEYINLYHEVFEKFITGNSYEKK